MRNQVKVAARCPLCRAGRASVCPGDCPPGKASLQGLGCPLSPVSFRFFVFCRPHIILAVSVAGGTGLSPTVLSLLCLLPHVGEGWLCCWNRRQEDHSTRLAQ